MNLHAIVGPMVGKVNPPLTAYIMRSNGYTTGPDGTRVPSYCDPVPVVCQVQSMQYNDLVQVEGLNIQGTKRKLYMNGHWDGLVRSDKKGGDLLKMPDGTTWLVVLVLEHWPDWSSIAITLQNGS